MVALSSSRLAAALGGLAFSLVAGAGIASAEPDLGPVMYSKCSYKQVVAALHAEYPDAAYQFDSTPEAQAWMHDLVDSPPPRRQQMLLDMKDTPEAIMFQDIVLPLANSCGKY
jgi:hemophore-related protein